MRNVNRVMPSRTGIAWAVLSGILGLCSIAGQAQELTARNVPDHVPPSEVEIGLDFERGGGGCFGRCLAYSVRLRGPGVVEYTDRGGEPRDAPRRREIPRQEFAAVLNDFLAAGFLYAPAGYVPRRATATPDSVIFRMKGGADFPTWTLSLRLGEPTKSVRLRIEYPPDLERLRKLVDDLGGPKAWSKQ